MLSFHRITFCAILGTMLSAVPSAQATLISFGRLTNNGPTNIASQLSVDVSASSGKILFKFANAGPTTSVVGQVYFDDNNSRLSNLTILDNTHAETSPGVSFLVGANPSDLPSGNTAVPPFVADFSAGADKPAPSNGIKVGETLGILFDGDLTQTLNDLSTGALRVGLHVQSIAQADYSDSFITVPEPTGTGLAIAGSVCLAMLRRCKRTPRS